MAKGFGIGDAGMLPRVGDGREDEYQRKRNCLKKSTSCFFVNYDKVVVIIMLLLMLTLANSLREL